MDKLTIDMERLELSLDSVKSATPSEAIEAFEYLVIAHESLGLIIDTEGRMIDLKKTVAKRDEQIEMLMAEMVELKARLDAPKAGNETPIGLN